MKVLHPITLRRLQDAQLIQFIKNILAITGQAAATLGFAGITAALHTDLLAMAESFKKKNLSGDTKELVALDLLRDRAFRTLKTRAESYLTDDKLPGCISHAEHIMVIIKRYGGSEISEFGFTKETAVISNLVTDLQDEAGNALQVLNLMPEVVFLTQCNTSFETKYALRGDAATQLFNIAAMHKLRPGVHANYAAFAQLIAGLQYFNTAEATAIGEVIDRINQEIKAFNALINNPEAAPPDTDA